MHKVMYPLVASLLLAGTVVCADDTSGLSVPSRMTRAQYEYLAQFVDTEDLFTTTLSYDDALHLYKPLYKNSNNFTMPLVCAAVYLGESSDTIVSSTNVIMTTDAMLESALSTAAVYDCKVTLIALNETNGVFTLGAIFDAYNTIATNEVSAFRQRMSIKDVIVQQRLAGATGYDLAVDTMALLKYDVLHYDISDEEDIRYLVNYALHNKGITVSADTLNLIISFLRSYSEIELDAGSTEDALCRFISSLEDFNKDLENSRVHLFNPVRTPTQIEDSNGNKVGAEIVNDVTSETDKFLQSGVQNKEKEIPLLDKLMEWLGE